MLKFLKLAFGAPATPRDPDVQIDDVTSQRIVGKHSHGNVRLQAGRFFTKSDIDAEVRSLKDVKLTV